MKRLLAVAVLLAATLPISASAESCMTETITWDLDSPSLEGTDVWVEGIRTAVVGTFLWVQYDEGSIVSVELPGGTASALVCPDGLVTLTRFNNVQAEPVVVDLVAVYAYDPTLDLRVSGPK